MVILFREAREKTFDRRKKKDLVLTTGSNRVIGNVANNTTGVRRMPPLVSSMVSFVYNNYTKVSQLM